MLGLKITTGGRSTRRRAGAGASVDGAVRQLLSWRLCWRAWPLWFDGVDVEHIRATFSETSERHACGLASMGVSSYRYSTRRPVNDMGLREYLTQLPQQHRCGHRRLCIDDYVSWFGTAVRRPITSACIGCIGKDRQPITRRPARLLNVLSAGPPASPPLSLVISSSTVQRS